MKCPLDVHRKARGHKRCAVPAKDEGKTGWGSSTQNWGPPQLWKGTETWECQCLRKCQGDIRREANEREEPSSGIIKAKGEKKYQYGPREHQSSSA